jgi:hypothetical protein
LFGTQIKVFAEICVPEEAGSVEVLTMIAGTSNEKRE